MATQYNLYTSSDAGGPGLLVGAANTLNLLLRGCLVNGYAGHPAPVPAWTEPVAAAGNIACFKPGAGAQMTMLVNDNGTNVTSTFREAWIVGWESVAGVGSPVGTGSGQFPTPAQQLTTGHGVLRKSGDLVTGRSWVLFADSYGLALFVDTGDTAGIKSTLVWGDVFSLKGATDAYRCILMCSGSENAAPSGSDPSWRNSVHSAAGAGTFMARTYGGGGTSILVQTMADPGMAVGPIGAMQAPNGPDNAYHMAPWRVMEATGKIMRGRLRGIYSMLHAPATFADGQTFNGAGDYAGKTFRIIRDVCGAPSGNGTIAIETSATVETN